jgi:phosphomevalonate kinase
VIRAIAPGKALLCGEYAVLEGAPAVAVAVDRVVRAEVRVPAGDSGPPTSFVRAASEHACRALASLGGERVLGKVPSAAQIRVDSSDLYEQAQKLGFGSSAAVTVATVGLIFAHAGRRELLDDRERLFAIADAAHAEAQGRRGSGTDVAAAIWGGTICLRRQNGRVTVEPLQLPADLQLTFVFTGKSASTPKLIGRVQALAERNPLAYRHLMNALRAEVEEFLRACRTLDRARLLATVRGYHDGLVSLGRAAETALVTPELAALAAIATRVGGAAKPSGAGGGDLGVAFTFDPDSTARLAHELRAVGLNTLSVGAPAPGLRLEICT